MDAGFLHGIWTAALLAVFAAIVAWAWSGRRRRDFDEAARIPLEPDAEDVAERAWDGGHDLDKAAHRCPEGEVTGPQERGVRRG